MADLTVIGPVASRTFRVLWMLEELGLAYDHHPEMPRSERVRALNPLGKVPVLLDGDRALRDSTAIVTFLADRAGRLTFPAGSHERARQDALTGFVLDEMDATLWAAAKHSFVFPEARRVPAVKPTLHWEWEVAEGRLEAMLGAQPFLMGETMTVPDILAVHALVWAERARFPLRSQAVADYAARLRARPAFGRAAAR